MGIASWSDRQNDAITLYTSLIDYLPWINAKMVAN